MQEDAPSVRQQRIDEDNERKAQLEAQKAAMQTADNKAMHQAIYQANGRFFDTSPQQLLLDGLGLSPQRAVQLLKTQRTIRRSLELPGKLLTPSRMAATST